MGSRQVAALLSCLSLLSPLNGCAPHSGESTVEPGAADASDVDGLDAALPRPPAPGIATSTLADATREVPYEQRLAATGGSTPLTWSVRTGASALQWLSIDANSGTLSGLPDRTIDSAKLTISVVDAEDRRAEREFALRVRDCRDGEEVACREASAEGCLGGFRTCAGGALGVCLGVVPSVDLEACGPTCERCAEGSDRCVEGRWCQCGENDPCAGGNSCCAGQCADLGSSLEHCGRCGNPCLPQGNHTVPACVAGVCNSNACEAGWLRCPLDAADCGVQYLVDAANCGGCGVKCEDNLQVAVASLHGSLECVAGACGVRCQAPFFDCNNDWTDGCEVDLSASSENCGACGLACPTPSLTSTRRCIQGVCESCAQGLVNCNWSSNPPDGCEASLDSNQNCGSCGRACGANEWCEEGRCCYQIQTPDGPDERCH